jgi:hypothetical protein
MFCSVSRLFVADVLGQLGPIFKIQYVRQERNFFVYIVTVECWDRYAIPKRR